VPQRSGRLSFLRSGDPASFVKHGARFLGSPLPPVPHIAEERGRLLRQERMSVPRGQLVR
jgi:hypothetical protein